MSKIRSLFLLLATFSLSGCALFPTLQIPSEPEISSSVHETSNPAEPISISVNQTEITLEVGQNVFVSARVTGSMNKNVTWASSDPGVAMVSGGTITGVKAGSATITAKSVADPTKTATVEVTVTEPVVQITKISEVLQIGSQLPDDGKTNSQEFKIRGVYTGMNDVVNHFNGTSQHTARFIQDGSSALLLSNTYDDDWADVQIGDVVEVTTAVRNLKGFVQSGTGKPKPVKKVIDPSIVAPVILNVSATSNPILTVTDAGRKARLDAVEVISKSTSYNGDITIKFSVGEDKTERTLFLKKSDNDLDQWTKVLVGSCISLDTWVDAGYEIRFNYFDNLTVDYSKFPSATEAKMGEIASEGNYTV
ncbi:MAG: Ig-like domain-containing protein, partial [Candidatus Enteromonas sp.]|nr:Ig-like domain-containing protein [Candidatus Enteromonas sp.]